VSSKSLSIFFFFFRSIPLTKGLDDLILQEVTSLGGKTTPQTYCKYEQWIIDLSHSNKFNPLVSKRQKTFYKKQFT